MLALFVVIVCLALNALLAGAEMAFVSVGKPQIKILASRGWKRAQTLLSLKQNPERILSVIQIGITLVGAVAAAVSGAGAEEAFGPWLQKTFKVSSETANAMAIGFVVLPLTYVNVVFGELIPKTLSIRHPLRIALIAAPWLALFDRVLSPIVSLLENSTKFFIKNSEHERPVAVEGQDFVELENLKLKTKEYVINMIHAEKKRAQDVMIPWADTRFVTKELTAAEIEKEILKTGHTRLPVKDGDDIIGLLHAKEFATLRQAGEQDWSGSIRTIIKVRALDPILEILPKMQLQRSHMAAVYDRMQLVGILTLEDIVEEIVGDIYDEDDDGRVARLLATRRKR